MAADAGFVNAPIPGMSLTTEPGNRPWENPPMLVTVEDALEFYSNKLIAEPENHDAILEMLELRVPVQNVATMLQKTSIMEGFHTIDVGILVTPAIEEMIMAVADMYGVRYAESMDQIMEGFEANPRAVRMAMQQLEKSLAEPEEEEGSLLAPPEEEALPEEPMGLMARPQKGMVE
jgi:hypothetical protein